MADVVGGSANPMSERLRELERTGEPAVLTLNSDSRLVIQDPATIHALIDVVLRAEELDSLRESVAQMRAGQVIPAEDVLGEMRTILAEKLRDR